MARMYPLELPEDVESSAERLLYDLFREQLPDDYVVLHGVKWLMRDRKQHDRDGEIDFLIVHPDRGLLVLEVKGGQIRVEAGQWYSVDASGQEHAIKNPFDQVQSNLYDLRAKLDESPTTHPFTYPLHRAVAFPHVKVGGGDIGLYGNRQLIIDSTDLYSLEYAVRRIAPPQDGARRLSPEAVDALVQLLEPTREITKLGLGAQVQRVEREIVRLTEEQFRLLDYLQLHPRALISGCAGSGKTMLAMEKARRLAHEGFRVLFTCFNQNLASWIGDRLRQSGGPAAETVQVVHYHGLVRQLCCQAGIALPPEPSEREEQRRYYEEVMPGCLLDAVAAVPDRFDAVIVDEGQDFHELWLMTLQELLVDQERGVFYVFYDPDQGIYGRRFKLPFDAPELTLTANCRTTVQIHQRVLDYYHGPRKPTPGGPQGAEPKLLPLPQAGDLAAVRNCLVELIMGEGFPAEQIVVLTPAAKPRSALTDGAQLGPATLTWNRRPKAGQVQVSTIHSFKGLESPIVILAELGSISDHGDRDQLMYVALSRARAHLYVLGELPEPTVYVPPEELFR